MPKVYKFNEDKEGFGNNLKNLMLKNGYTIESFSEKIGYDENTIKKWRAGKRIPDLEKIYDMAQIFDVSVHELYLPNSIYENQLSNDFINVIDGRFEIKPSDISLIEELRNYSNYLFQKMLFSYLNPRDIKAMKNIYKYFTLSDYAVDRFSITDVKDFCEFHIKIKKYLIEQFGVGLPYKINNDISNKILDDFKKCISLNIKEEE